MSKVAPEERIRIESMLDVAYLSRINDLKRSVTLAGEALQVSRELDDTVLIAKSLNKLALFKMILGEYQESVEMATEALGLFNILNDKRGIADVKYTIAGTYYKTDNFHLGLIHLIDALEIYRVLDDYHNQARVHKSLGTIYEYFGDERSAILAYEYAIMEARRVGDKDLESNAYNPLSGIMLNQGDIQKASDIIERSIEMKELTGDLRGLAFAYYGRAKVLVKQGEFEKAIHWYITALRIHEEMGERLGAGMCYLKLGALYFIKQENQKAIEVLNKAIDFAITYKMVLINFKSNFLLYQIYKDLKDSENALKYLEIYLKEKEAVINTQTQKVIESYEAISRMKSLERENQLKREKALLMEKKNRAEQESKVKQEFLSTMSHEIRTPLNAVISISSLLEEKTDEEEKKLLESLRFSANNLLMIINDILDFNKLDSGNVKLEFRPTNLFDLLKNIHSTYISMANQKGLQFELEINDVFGGYYMLDETKITQILGNLVSNAVKFTEKGSLTLTVRKLIDSSQYDQLEFSVVDTGMGIPKNFIPKIFDSFSQPKARTTRRQGGSGLGLAIVKKMIELHGSNIHVDTKINEGSKFYFQLSLRKSTSVNRAIKSIKGALSGMTVLVAEDNVINAMVIKKLLFNWGMIVDLAVDGLETVKMAKRKKYDYILMDIHMPEMDGFNAAKLIREESNPNKKSPIFALTADVTTNQVEEFTHYFNGILLKPIEKDKLYISMANLIKST